MEFKLPQRLENSNKATYGRVLNIAGSDYMPGAAYLSSVSALKIGCGYCFLCSSENVIAAVAAQTQNVVFVPYSNLGKILETANVVEIGCGLSQSEKAFELFDTVIQETNRETPLIIDADGLNILAKSSEQFLSKRINHVVLTPHPKEAARLLDCGVEEVLSDTEISAHRISQKYNCITALKTHRTVVTSFDGRIYTNTTGNNAMAKAGSGDVLTGIIAGLIAQSMDIYAATVSGVYLHGLCGDIAKEKLTEYSVMAEDLISCIPSAIKFIQTNN